jgi:hypothetical protein
MTFIFKSVFLLRETRKERGVPGFPAETATFSILAQKVDAIKERLPHRK